MFVRLIGDFRVTTSAGQDVTPTSAKARALLAILARTPDRKRSRRWIESCLWADRGGEQAAGSLRQVLTETRRALGDHSSWLQADRTDVAIGPLTTDVGDRPEEALQALRRGRDLLEGLRVMSDAFETWRTAEGRQILTELDRTGIGVARPAHVPPGRPLVVRVDADTAEPGSAAPMTGHLLGDAIAGLMSEFGEIDVYPSHDNVTRIGLPENGLILGIRSVAVGDEVQLLAGLTARGSGRLLWSRGARVDTSQGDLLHQGDIPSLIYEAAEAALTTGLRIQERDPLAMRVDGLVAKAIPAMFTYEGPQLRLSEALLAEATSLLPSPRLLAWRCLVRQIMIVERTETNHAELAEEANAFARQAVIGAQGNSLVLSLAAQLSAMVEYDTDISGIQAQRAIDTNPFNAFSHSAAATVALRAGRGPKALQHGQRSATLARQSHLGHWFDAIAGLAAISAGHIDLGIGHYEVAHARAPSFRAPLRALLNLYLSKGDHARARRAARHLTQIEPDFDPLRLIDDDTYPVFTLRRERLVPPREVLASIAS
ncbi:MAG: hypothetical protein AAGE03_16855 [Pseudomonadota bacterium]